MRKSLFLVLVALLSYGCAEESTSSPTPTDRLIEAGWSFGFCLGPCNGTLEIDGRDLTYVVRNREETQVFASNQGRLTDSGEARLTTLVSELPETLQDTYGCPDCADAGAAYVLLDRGDSIQRANYEYPNPPPELASLDAFLKEVMDALGECQASGNVTLVGNCTPVPR